MQNVICNYFVTIISIMHCELTARALYHDYCLKGKFSWKMMHGQKFHSLSPEKFRKVVSSELLLITQIIEKA